MDEYDDRPGRCNSVCLFIFNLITFILCLCLYITVTYLMDANFCQIYYSCCSYSCWNLCARSACYGGEWLTVRPIGQDKLPPPANVTSPGETETQFTVAGDGEVDYWSVAVTAIVGPIACFIVMIAACAAGAGRSGPAACSGISMIIGGLAKVACCVCLGSQLWTSYDGQWVYNAFREDPYVKINGAIITYLYNDYYLWGWGNLVAATFAFLIITIIYDLIYGLVALCCNDHAYTGVKEYESSAVQYARKRSAYKANQYSTYKVDTTTARP